MRAQRSRRGYMGVGQAIVFHAPTAPPPLGGSPRSVREPLGMPAAPVVNYWGLLDCATWLPRRTSLSQERLYVGRSRQGAGERRERPPRSPARPRRAIHNIQQPRQKANYRHAGR